MVPVTTDASGDPTADDPDAVHGASVVGSVLIVGVGAVGGALAWQLARLGVRLCLIDKGVLGKANLNWHEANADDLGQPKATALADHIRERLAGSQVVGIPADFTRLESQVRDEHLAWADVVVGATDDARAQRLVNQDCLDAAAPAVFPGVWIDPMGESEAGEIFWYDPRYGNMPCYECLAWWRRGLAGDAQPGEHGGNINVQALVGYTATVVNELLNPLDPASTFLRRDRSLIRVRGDEPLRSRLAKDFPGGEPVSYAPVSLLPQPCPACHQSAPIDEIWGGTILPPERPMPPKGYARNTPVRRHVGRRFGIVVGFLALIALILVVLARSHSSTSSAPELSVPSSSTAHWRIVCVNYTLPSQPNSPVTPCPGGQFGVYDPTDSLIRISYEIQGMNSTYSELYARGSLKERIRFYSDSGADHMIRIRQNPHIDKTGKHFVFDSPGAVAKVVVELYCNKRSRVCHRIGQVIWKGQNTVTMLPVLPSAPPSGSSSAPPTGAKTASVTVPADSQDGVKTGIYARKGDKIVITGSGSAGYGYDGTEGCVGSPTTHPDGSRYLGSFRCSPKDDPEAVLSRAAIGQLVARIGGGPWFGVGSGTTITAGRSGYIYLAYNDSAYSDNTGSYSARVTSKGTGSLASP